MMVKAAYVVRAREVEKSEHDGVAATEQGWCRRRKVVEGGLG